MKSNVVSCEFSKTSFMRIQRLALSCDFNVPHFLWLQLWRPWLHIFSSLRFHASQNKTLSCGLLNMHFWIMRFHLNQYPALHAIAAPEQYHIGVGSSVPCGWGVPIYVYIYIYTYRCVCMHAYMHACMYACMHGCMYGCIYVRTYIRAYVPRYAGMYVGM